LNIPTLSLANNIGVIAFAISGVYKGINKNLDALGVSVLGFMTALGGGAVRDVLADRTPLVFVGYSDISFAVLGIVIAFSIYKATKMDISNSLIVKISDAIGLAAFTVIGAMVGIECKFNIVGVMFLGMVTGVGGGLISDILVLRIPMVLSEDFYATCSLAGAFWIFMAIKLNFGDNIAIYSSFFIVLTLRVLAIVFKWQLPKSKH
jgi:uncharacterized membrane protein YeiH